MTFLKNSAIYLGSSIVNKAIPFLLLPVMTKYLSTSQYGKMAIYLILISFYSAFIGMAINTSISKNYYNYSKEKMAIHIGNIFIILFVSFSIFLILTLAGWVFFDNLFSISYKWIVLIPFISLATMINTINLTIFRNEGRALKYGIYEILKTIINVGLTLIFLLYFNSGWYSQVIGIFASFFIFSIIGTIIMYKGKYISFRIDYDDIKYILKLSVPLIPHVIAGIIIALSDRIFIERMVGLSAVGIYSVGYTFGSILIIYTDAFQMAWGPWFYKEVSVNSIKNKIKVVKYTYLYILSIFIISCSLSFFAVFILPLFVNNKYESAKYYIPWITIAYAFQGLYKVFMPYLVHLHRTSYLAFSSTIAAIINIVLNYFLIKEFGALGGAYATVIAFLSSAVLVFLYQFSKIKMPWDYLFNYKRYNRILLNKR
jgi:O-antigen/teichoic acid export membrane protein